jgi:hypothetical protein
MMAGASSVQSWKEKLSYDEYEKSLKGDAQ